MRLPKTILTPETPEQKPEDSKFVQVINSLLPPGRKLSKKAKEVFTKNRLVEGVKCPSLEYMWDHPNDFREFVKYIDLLKLKRFFKQANSPEHVVNTLMGYNGVDALGSPIEPYTAEEDDEQVTLK